MDKTVNALGLACPLPVVETKKALETMTEAGILTVLVDNEVAVQNVSKFAESRNLSVRSEKAADKEFHIMITVFGEKSGEKAVEAEGEEPVCIMDGRQKGLVVVIGSNQMGNGEEKLGKNLMKAFIFALTKQDVLPETILFYNSGAYLTCEDSDSLADLKDMEAQGVEILTCGTCLDFYGLKEKLAVGSVTNMYVIVEKQEKACRIVKP